MRSTGSSIPSNETARAVFDRAYNGTGNWVFNVAYSGRLGLRGGRRASLQPRSCAALDRAESAAGHLLLVARRRASRRTARPFGRTPRGALRLYDQTAIARSTTLPHPTYASSIRVTRWNASGSATKASRTSWRRSASSTPTSCNASREIQGGRRCCERCPRLRAYTSQIARERKRAHRRLCLLGQAGAIVRRSPSARVMLVGLAPGAHGSNRTGRPFTGDASGGFLFPALYRAGFASQPDAMDRNDGCASRLLYYRRHTLRAAAK